MIACLIASRIMVLSRIIAPPLHACGNTCPFSNLYFDIGRTDDIVSQNRRWSALIYALLDLT